ncbi:PIG-L deacetylase family protein [Leptospira bandrabouensis]|uniref:PIG-L family deacetylase n=1 Tax=Leptospira bandrabouensis TaxID=2484903 RepID=A0A6H3NR81_9LEPT|nr:PIG-L deacetylase family protein [Leptospira bandrabouensis]TGN03785.1 PIG-L family deacetylase [Leptospira bandrabouensis]TGN12189.1 PIG-L family deacetylase [Leptospira bandrabouensis]
MKKTILTIAAHPDDEILGCGGTMARLSEEGHNVHILILAEGLTSRQVIRDRNSKVTELGDLAISAKKSAEVVGAKSIELLDFPDNRMDSIDRLDVIKVIEEKLDELNPSIVFTHFGNDLNIDHRVVNEAVVTACRPIPGHSVRELYFFEVPSSTEWQIQNGIYFQPNVFFELGNSHFKKKKEALLSYDSEMRNFPHARSIEAVEALAKWRGASIGANFAEAFIAGRVIK